MNTLREEKQGLRRQYMDWRCGLSIAEWQYRSRLLGDRLMASPVVQGAGTILAYQSHRQEPDLSKIWMATPGGAAEIYPEKSAKIWGLPRCIKGEVSDGKPTRLCWHQWRPGDELQVGTYGLREPDPDWPILTVEQVDVVLVPMIAGDRQGYRLGYGGGFYDRLFSDSRWRSVVKIGLTFQELLVDRLPRELWDCPLDAICTDQEWLDISGQELRS